MVGCAVCLSGLRHPGVQTDAGKPGFSSDGWFYSSIPRPWACLEEELRLASLCAQAAAPWATNSVWHNLALEKYFPIVSKELCK